MDKLTWKEIIIMLVIAVAVGYYDYNKEGKLYVECADHTTEEVTKETQTVCGGAEFFYDELEDKYYYGKQAYLKKNQMTEIDEYIKFISMSEEEFKEWKKK